MASVSTVLFSRDMETWLQEMQVWLLCGCYKPSSLLYIIVTRTHYNGMPGLLVLLLLL